MNTISDLLERKRELNCGIRVRTAGNIVSFEIVGFIPCSDVNKWGLYFYDIDNYALGANYIRFKNNSSQKRYQPFEYLPITKSVRKEEKCEMTNILRHLDKGDTDFNKEFTRICSGLESKLLNEAEFQKHDEKYYYPLSEGEYTFSRHNKVLAVASTFMCLCIYISPQSGKLEYRILMPDELYPIIN